MPFLQGSGIIAERGGAEILTRGSWCMLENSICWTWQHIPAWTGKVHRVLSLSGKLLAADGSWGRENQFSSAVGYALRGHPCSSTWSPTHAHMVNGLCGCDKTEKEDMKFQEKRGGRIREELAGAEYGRIWIKYICMYEYEILFKINCCAKEMPQWIKHLLQKHEEGNLEPHNTCEKLSWRGSCL